MVAWCEETPTEHRSGDPVATKLHRIVEKARNEPSFKFTSLYHLMNEELLRECFQRLRKDAAAGIDDLTKEQYAENFDANLSSLIERLHRMAYRPQPVRRMYIPKPGSDQPRPLGIPCFEDKLVQAGLVRILESVFEQDFIEDSYGFRPGRSCHQALRALGETAETKPINHIVEADIKGFFNHVNQEWLMKFLAHRIGGTTTIPSFWGHKSIYIIRSAGYQWPGSRSLSRWFSSINLLRVNQAKSAGH